LKLVNSGRGEGKYRGAYQNYSGGEIVRSQEVRCWWTPDGGIPPWDFKEKKGDEKTPPNKGRLAREKRAVGGVANK